MTDKTSRFAAAFYWVELMLEAERFPDGAAFAWLIVGISATWALDCIELAIGPQGGGRLSFIVHSDAAEETLRASLRAIAGDEAIARCRRAT
jgi:hypothetical protein